MEHRWRVKRVLSIKGWEASSGHRCHDVVGVLAWRIGRCFGQHGNPLGGATPRIAPRDLPRTGITCSFLYPLIGQVGHAAWCPLATTCNYPPVLQLS